MDDLVIRELAVCSVDDATKLVALCSESVILATIALEEDLSKPFSPELSEAIFVSKEAAVEALAAAVSSLKSAKAFLKIFLS